jgi:hypothetical protein
MPGLDMPNNCKHTVKYLLTDKLQKIGFFNICGSTLEIESAEKLIGSRLNNWISFYTWTPMHVKSEELLKASSSLINKPLF